MRKLIAVFTLCAATALVPSAGALALPGGEAERDDAEAESPEQTLANAVRVLRPDLLTRIATGGQRREATLVLRDLHQRLPELDEDGQQLAESVLARPTDRGRDPAGYGYRTKQISRKCARTVCVHWARTTKDKPPSRRWALRNLRTLQKVYDFQVGELGFRRPVPDGDLGGNSKLDVYLKDLGAGLYGYCAPEYYKPGSRKVASAYCVIDNDFAGSQFVGSPGRNLRVTLAHEFFHAVQFAYSINGDRWIYESTATWMEEQFADDVNDNRQYLPKGQIGDPRTPLDTFDGRGVAYGNWPWWEFLANRLGRDVVRRVWEQMDANKGRPGLYSTRALRKVLRTRGGFRKLFSAYAAANVTPHRSYPEGSHWPRARPDRSRKLRVGKRRETARVKIDHMASGTVRLAPARSLRRGWKLRVRVEGPPRRTGAQARLVIKRPGGRQVRRTVALDRSGNGAAQLGFSRSQVRNVTVVLVNASTRFRCWKGTDQTCRGRARDDASRFVVRARAFR